MDAPVQEVDAGSMSPAVPVAFDLDNVKEVVLVSPEYGPVGVKGTAETLRSAKVISGPVPVLLVFGTEFSCIGDEFL
jgi:hypothetical protein